MYQKVKLKYINKYVHCPPIILAPLVNISKGGPVKINLYCLSCVPCGSVVEHCVSSAKGCGFDSQGTHVLMKMYNLNAIVSRFG